MIINAYIKGKIGFLLGKLEARDQQIMANFIPENLNVIPETELKVLRKYKHSDVFFKYFQLQNVS